MVLNCFQLLWRTNSIWLLQFLKQGRKELCRGKFYKGTVFTLVHIFPVKDNLFSKYEKVKICTYELYNKLFPLNYLTIFFYFWGLIETLLKYKALWIRCMLLKLCPCFKLKPPYYITQDLKISFHSFFKIVFQGLLDFFQWKLMH